MSKYPSILLMSLVLMTYIIPWLAIAGTYASRIIEQAADAILLEPLRKVWQDCLLGHVELAMC